MRASTLRTAIVSTLRGHRAKRTKPHIYKSELWDNTWFTVLGAQRHAGNTPVASYAKFQGSRP